MRVEIGTLEIGTVETDIGNQRRLKCRKILANSKLSELKNFVIHSQADKMSELREGITIIYLLSIHSP